MDTSSTIFQKYAAVLLPFFVLVIGASQTVFEHPTDLTVIIPFAILVLGAIGTYVVKLFPEGWAGRAKTGIAIGTAVLSALIPFVLPGGFDPKVSGTIIAVAVLNALATQLGVTIRVASPAKEPGEVKSDQAVSQVG